jgi:hypothetical protein
MLLFSVVAESSNAITTRYQPSPGSSPGAGLKRFASSELLKIETATWLLPLRAEAKRKRTSCAFVWIQETGGGERDRTDDLLLAKQALSQLSYTPGSAPHRVWWVWLDSNQRPPPYQDGALTS